MDTQSSFPFGRLRKQDLVGDQGKGLPWVTEFEGVEPSLELKPPGSHSQLMVMVAGPLP